MQLRWHKGYGLLRGDVGGDPTVALGIGSSLVVSIYICYLSSVCFFFRFCFCFCSYLLLLICGLATTGLCSDSEQEIGWTRLILQRLM